MKCMQCGFVFDENRAEMKNNHIIICPNCGCEIDLDLIDDFLLGMLL